MPVRFRRILTLLFALTFVAGTMPLGMRTADAGAQMIMTAAGDMPMSNKCDGCGDDQKAMASAACSAFCVSLVALPSMATLLEPPSAEAFMGFAGMPLAGHALPPDPYPPRPAVLS